MSNLVSRAERTESHLSVVVVVCHLATSLTLRLLGTEEEMSQTAAVLP